MKDLSKLGYTHDEVYNALLTNREVGFRFELKDKNDIRLGDVTATGEINLDTEMTISRAANLQIKEIKEINTVDEMIQAYFRLHIGKNVLEYPLGLFYMNTGNAYHDGYSTYVSNECYDSTIVLSDDKFDSRYLITQGTSYTSAVNSILINSGFTRNNIETSQLQIQQDIEFDIGTSKIDAINSLLQAINYTKLYFDETGIPTATRYSDYNIRVADHTYKADDNSIISLPIVRNLDTYNFPNKFVRYTENAETGCLKSTYINNNPNSKLSVFSRKRTIVDIESVTDIADQTTLDAYTRRIAQQRSLYEIVEIDTAIMPTHGYGDCVSIEIPQLDLNGKYIETSWTINLSAGGGMKHKLKRVIEM